MADTDLSNTIATMAASPLEVEGDYGRTKERSLSEIIAADKYLKSQNAVSQDNPLGILFGVFSPDGAL